MVLRAPSEPLSCGHQGSALDPKFGGMAQRCPRDGANGAEVVEKCPPTTLVIGGLRDAPSAHRRAWLSLGRLLFSGAYLRFTRMGRDRIRTELPSSDTALDEVTALESAECVNDALHAYP